jgi:hypothetical protein
MQAIFQNNPSSEKRKNRGQNRGASAHPKEFKEN